MTKTSNVNLGPAPNINGNRFDSSTTYLDTFAAGTVNEIQLNGVNAHPFHLHINSYQITADPADTNGGYFLGGDWYRSNPIQP